MPTYLADQFKEIFIKKVMETDFRDKYFKEDMVFRILWNISSTLDEDMDFGVYRHGNAGFGTEEPDTASFFTYFTDRSTAIMKVYFVPEVSVEVIAFAPVLYKTEAEEFVEEFRNSKEHTPETIDKILAQHSPILSQSGPSDHLPPMCENELNWRLRNEMACEFVTFSDGSSAAFQKEWHNAWVHNYLK